jgi:hypothetical protein
MNAAYRQTVFHFRGVTVFVKTCFGHLSPSKRKKMG